MRSVHRDRSIPSPSGTVASIQLDVGDLAAEDAEDAEDIADTAAC